MTHAGKEVRFRQVGFFRGGPALAAAPTLFSCKAWSSVALGDIARRGEYALQIPVAIVKGGRVVGDHGLFAVPRASGQLIIGDFVSASTPA